MNQYQRFGPDDPRPKMQSSGNMRVLANGTGASLQEHAKNTYIHGAWDTASPNGAQVQILVEDQDHRFWVHAIQPVAEERTIIAGPQTQKQTLVYNRWMIAEIKPEDVQKFIEERQKLYLAALEAQGGRPTP